MLGNHGRDRRENHSQEVCRKQKAPIPDDRVGEGGRLLPKLKFLRIAKTTLTDVFRILRHVGLRQAHLCETSCFLPSAKPV